MTNAPAFTAWLDDFFASYYQHRPVNATFIGVHAHDERLPDYSEHGLGDALADADTLLARLAARFELDAAAREGIAARLDELIEAGLVERA